MEVQNNSSALPALTKEPVTKVSDNEVIATLRNPSSLHGSKETFLEEAERLLLLRHLGVDIETLNEVEQEIDDLENIAERNDEEQTRLEYLLDKRAELFREAMERRNGEILPPGSMVSLSV